MIDDLPTRALSLRQPWCDAVVNGTKRIENRTKWFNSRVRGPIFLHAAVGMTRAEYKDVVRFLCDRRITREDWQPPPPEELQRGGIVGIARIIGVVNAKGRVTIDEHLACVERGTLREERELTEEEAQWWMGGFALVLAHVQPLPFTPCKGALGFFKVPADVRSFAESRPRKARSPSPR